MFWRRVVFSDEKKFKLDGPDGYRYYWHDVRQDPDLFSRRVSGGGSVMIWAVISWHGKTKLVVLEGRQRSIDYTRTLRENLLPYLETLRSNHEVSRPVFQHDNASIHSARHAKDFLHSESVSTLKCPAKSPDLNTIANVWGGGRQFDSAAELKRCILKCWEEIPQEYIQTLVKSMATRIVQVVLRRGAAIDY
ncbi:unnamed protein product [Phytophthora fragariaefolia]|uniref:Unnamed protein product n=1 Tax=Phytophthora fragariaefolia TaxID=1490495 RepID=A0A9W7CV69_9STRA|nr:unnamed protein product [Phytophthora fragariaefolia]